MLIHTAMLLCIKINTWQNNGSYVFFPKVFLEQKKMLKTGLSVAHFRTYVPLIEKETIDYFERWGDSGEKGKCFDHMICRD